MTRFVVFVPAFQCEAYIARSLRSIVCQREVNFRVICVVDAASDATLTLASAYESGDVRVIMNPKRQGVIGNTWMVAHELCEPDEIMVQVDGDDQLAHDRVLARVGAEYQDPDVWLTYGSYASDVESRNPDPAADPRGIACQIPPGDHTRRSGWRSTHLRTWKTWLFRKIPRPALEAQGAWIDAAPDLATMWPMIEMAGPRHARYVHDVLYLKNDRNPLNEAKCKPLQAEGMARWLASQPPFLPFRDPGDAPRRES